MQGGNLLNCLKNVFNDFVQIFLFLRPNWWSGSLKSKCVKVSHGKQLCEKRQNSIGSYI